MRQRERKCWCRELAFFCHESVENRLTKVLKHVLDRRFPPNRVSVGRLAASKKPNPVFREVPGKSVRIVIVPRIAEARRDSEITFFIVDHGIIARREISFARLLRLAPTLEVTSP